MQDYYAVKISPSAVSSLNFSAVQGMTGYVGPTEPGVGLVSMYMGSNVSDGGDEQANSRGNVIIGPSAGAANGDALVGGEISLPPTDPDPTAIFDSVIIGAEAGSGIKRGVGIVAIGRYSTQSCVRYGNNTAVGDSTLRYCETGGNSAFGYVCLEKFTTGQYNNGFGLGAGTNLLTGSKNCYFGHTAGASQTANDGVCAFGHDSLYNALGGNNCAFGLNSGRALVNGTDNIFIGDEAGSTSTSQAGTCSNAIVIGADAFSLVSNRIVIGNSSHTTAKIFGALTAHGNGAIASNTALGLDVLNSITTANQSTAVGVSAMISATTANDSCAYGFQAMYSTTTGIRNCAYGSSSLQSNIAGLAHCAFGYSAGFRLTGGQECTYVGYRAGESVSQKVDAVNSTAIGAYAYNTADNQVVVGDSNVTETILRGNVAIPTATVATLVATTAVPIMRSLVTSMPAGGADGIQLGSGAATMSILWGSGAPSASAVKGSLYLRSDGTTTNDRMYVNTDGSTTWTAVTTVA